MGVSNCETESELLLLVDAVIFTFVLGEFWIGFGTIIIGQGV